jgi:surface antigen
MMVVLTIGALLGASCSGNTASNIIGKWNGENDPTIGQTYMEFLKDGTCIFGAPGGGVSFEYSFPDDKHINFQANQSIITAGFSLSGDTLTLTDFMGETVHLHRNNTSNLSNNLIGVTKDQPLPSITDTQLIAQAQQTAKGKPQPENYTSCLVYAKARGLGDKANGNTGAFNILYQENDAKLVNNSPTSLLKTGIKPLQNVADLTTVLKPGDFIVWQRNIAGADRDYGHIAVVELVQASRIVISQSNWSPNWKVLHTTDLVSGIYGYSFIATTSSTTSSTISDVTELKVDSTNPQGVKFVAPENGSYEITISGGAWVHLPVTDPNWSIYGGWQSWLVIYKNKPVEWGNPTTWGKQPTNFDYELGSEKSYSSQAEAIAANQGTSIKILLNKGEYVIALESDHQGYYYDNNGIVTIRIIRMKTADISSGTLTDAQLITHTSCLVYAQKARNLSVTANGNTGAFNILYQGNDAKLINNSPTTPLKSGIKPLQGVGNLATVLKPGDFIVWQRGVANADKDYGHIAVVELMEADRVVIS